MQPLAIMGPPPHITAIRKGVETGEGVGTTKTIGDEGAQQVPC